MFALSILYPNDRLTGFAMATKTCRAAKLYQRPLNSMRSLSVLKSVDLKVSILRDERLVKKSVDLLWTLPGSLYPSLCMRARGKKGVLLLYTLKGVSQEVSYCTAHTWCRVIINFMWPNVVV